MSEAPLCIFCTHTHVHVALILGCRVHFAECVCLLACESELPHENVDLLFTITNQNIKLTVLWGG